MVGCNVNVDALWFYHCDHNKDHHCICSTYMGKWPDLCRNFRVQYFAYSAEQLPVCTAVTMAQAVCCSFITHLHLSCQRANAQALGWPGQATLQQVHAAVMTQH